MSKAEEVPYLRLDVPSKRKCCCTKRLCGIIIAVIALSFGCLIITGITLWPKIHASCTVYWTFGEGCFLVNNALTDQIHKWESPDNCKDGGEKCNYKLVSRTYNVIKATHTTPVKHYVDDLTFTLSDKQLNVSCQVKGYSTSEVWYAVFDFGTNYCNLHNLITGSSLDKVANYTEKTSDSICTQYSSSNCTKY